MASENLHWFISGAVFWDVSKHLFCLLYFILLVKRSCILSFSFSPSNVFVCLDD